MLSFFLNELNWSPFLSLKIRGRQQSDGALRKPRHAVITRYLCALCGVGGEGLRGLSLVWGDQRLVLFFPFLVGRDFLS